MRAYLHTNIKYYMHTYQQFNDEMYVTSYNPYSHCCISLTKYLFDLLNASGHFYYS